MNRSMHVSPREDFFLWLKEEFLER